MPGYANPFQGDPAPGGLDEDFYLNADPTSAFFKYLQGVGLDGSGAGNPTARYAQTQQNRVYGNYSAASASNPELGFWDYLKQQKPDFSNDYMSQSPEQRGDYSSRIMTPRARWVTG